MRSQPVLDAARRVVLVVGAGAVGAAVCSTGVHLLMPSGEGLRPVRAADSPPSRQRPLAAGEQRAVDLLRRAGRAEAALAYGGSKFFGSWSAFGHTSVLAQVSHRPGEGTEVVLANGAPNRQFVAADGQTRLDARTLAALTRRYRLRVARVEGCIGRPAVVVEAARGDGVVAGRFWLDQRTGLTLRRELFDRQGRQIRLTMFLDVRIADHGPLTAITPAPTPGRAEPTAMPSADSGRALDADALDQLRADGWTLPDLLPTGLTLFDARDVTVDGANAVHLTYSDGLFMMSMFAQRGRLDTDELPGLTARSVGDTTVHVQSGLYRHLSWEGGGLVYTMVTDAPDESARAVVAAMPHEPHDGSVLGRMSRGVARMGALLDPFD